MGNVTGASLQPIYERLNAAPAYHPLEADTFADPSMEAGDVVTFSRDGVNYSSPIHSSSLVWKKGTTVTINSSGNEKRDSIAKVSRQKYGRGGSSLRNSHYLHYYVDDAYNQMRSGLELTGSAASLYVQNLYNQMKAGLDLTTSHASLYVQNMYNQMKAGLDLTSSTAHLYVRNYYSQMQSGLALASSSAALYVQNRTTRAYIMTRINADGEGEALIEADKVSITGDTTLAGSLEISSGNLVVKKSANFQGNITLTTAGSTVQAPQFAVSSGGYLRFIGEQTGEHYDLTAASIVNYIRKAEVDSNTNQLKLWKVSDSDQSPSITFSKAVALTGAWSNGKYTVSATSGSISGTIPSEDITLGFNANNGTYYIEAIATNQSGTSRSVKTSSYKLDKSGTNIQIQDTNGTRITNTPQYTISLQSKSVSASVQQAVEVEPDNSYVGLSKVTVAKLNVHAEEAWPSTSVQYIYPSPGYDYISYVKICKMDLDSLTINKSAVTGTGTGTFNASDDGLDGYSSVTYNRLWMFSSTTKPSNVPDNKCWEMKETSYDKRYYYISSSADGNAAGGECWYVSKWPTAASYNFSCSQSADIQGSNYSVSNHLDCGGVSKAALSAYGYIRFKIKCDGHEKWCKISVNP